MSSSLNQRLNRRTVAATGASLVAASAWAGTTGHTLARQASPVPGAAIGEVTLERVALAVKRLPELAKRILGETGVPGMAVAVVYDGALEFSGGFGVRELGKDEPIDDETVFQLASVSKSLASTVAASVVSSGEVAWLSKISDIAPGFALKEAWPTEAVSVADLFSHRSGLPDHGGDLLEDLGYGRDEILHNLRFLEPEYSFREGYAYSNFGLTAGAEAVAHAAGKSWEDLSDERLYQPLGMSSTSSRFVDYMARENRAIPHRKIGDKWEVTNQQRDPDPESPAGGASSSVRDLERWLRLWLDRGKFDGAQLISEAAMGPVHIPQSVANPPADPWTQKAGFYGFGVDVSYNDFGKPQWGHSGAFNLGASTAYYMLPGAGFGVVVLTNGNPVGAPEAVCLTVLDIVQGVEPPRDWLTLIAPIFAGMSAPTYGTGTDWNTPPTAATPALVEKVYVGTYHDDFYGDAEIVSGDNGLSLQIGPKPLGFPLNHYDRDTFTWQPEGENAYGPSGLTFTVGPDQIATGFTDEYLGWDGTGHMVRVMDTEG